MPALSHIPNEMIRASAGSGKTYQLTNRYIALMAVELKSGREVHPERIIAVTFTRKAAGEFFDAILVKLAKASTDPNAGSELAGPGTDPLAEALRSLSQEEFRELLRIFIQRMPRLFLGTLDSFFSNILRSFPSEFGLTSDFEVMDDYRAANAIDRVYEAVFSRRIGPNQDDQYHDAFLESFRQATFGKEESNVIRSLDDFVEKLHGIYLNAPSEKFWGDPTQIWSRETNRWLVDGISPDKEITRLFETFESIPEQVNETYWNEFRAEIEEHFPGAPFGKRTNYMLPRLLEAWPQLEAGHAEIKFNRTVHEFNAVACEAVQRILQWLIGSELKTKLQRTRGVWELLNRYESVYSDRVRRIGQLTFQDVQLLLAGHESIRSEGDKDRNAPVLTQMPDDFERLRIDYRLDARYNHWLLDEFQDTNFIQWKVISNLIDEVVQDTSGTRSLFQVGDIKQAIYAWRGGDTRLFNDIFEHYNANGERVLPRSLDTSFRSVSAVLDPVNTIFRDEAAMRAIKLPDETLNRWEWNDHLVADTNKDKSGYTAFLNPQGSDGGKPGQEDLYKVVQNILEETEPTKRGLSCAILVRGNKRGHEIVEYLRANSDIPVVSESDQLIATDNPVNLALLSFFQLAAHPGDKFAWEHLRMSPFRSVIEENNLRPGKLARQLASDIFEIGFEPLVRQLAQDLESACGTEFDAFTKGRIENFALAARLYGETGSRDIDDFLAYVSRHTTRESVDSSAVQVMTYHKSKGLTFDMVILPDLKSDSLTSAKLDIGAKTNEHREVQWVLDMPGKEITAADPVLGEYLAEKQAESAYESLCMYYVAMTRARYANYLVALPQGPKSRSMNFVKLIEDTLADEPQDIQLGDNVASLLFETNSNTGGREWFENHSLKSSEPEASKAPADQAHHGNPEPRLRPRRRTPSGSEERQLSAKQLFQSSGSYARELGTLVHALFEKIEWADEKTTENLREQWTGKRDPLFEEAFQQIENSLGNPEISSALSRTSETSELWREKNFEILLDGAWLSGTFDRVVLEPGKDGLPASATIIDFKTDQVDESSLAEAAQKHRSQLKTYREVLSKMTGLPQESISTFLLFTRVAKLTRI
ncbi:UvrD-helicase domain-containing protein [Verrucomicrobiales bacterium BCK34]|nr:UvrD-helicase domain-containing protein [Verrucomicrobiales bacterium BCK34]